MSQHRLLRSAALVCVALLSGSATPATAQTCEGLFADLQSLRVQFKDEMRAQGAAMLADLEAYGFKVAEETWLAVGRLSQRWQDAQEGLVTGTLNIGPQHIAVPGRQLGRNLVKAGIGGERTFYTNLTGHARTVEVEVEKTGGRASGTVTVCRWDADDQPQVVATRYFPDGNTTATRTVKVQDLLGGEHLTIHVVNTGGLRSFQYDARTRVTRRYEKYVEEVSPVTVIQEGDGVTSMSGAYDMTYYAPNGPIGQPVATGTAQFGFFEDPTLVNFYPGGAAGITFPSMRIPAQRIGNGIRERGGPHGLDIHEVAGGAYEGTMTTEGQTYRVRLVPR